MTTPVLSSTLLDNLASYVPQVVMRAIAATPAPLTEPAGEWVPAAVLFADISGFTHLTERLTARGPAGVEELSNILNTYFGQLIDVVLDHGGDIVEFTGDGIIAIWSVPPDTDLTAAVGRAAAGGLAVQRDLAQFAFAEHAQLSLRISIGAGDVLIACVGGVLGRWELLVAGDPLVQVGAAEPLARPGEIVLSAEAWQHLSAHASGQPLAAGVVRLDALGFVPSSPPQSPIQLTTQMIPGMSSFLPGAILDRLEAGLSDWLAELRYVTIVFLNVRNLDYHVPDVVEQLHTIMRALQTSLYQYEGSVNQFIVDDKGTTFVAALGLPPLTHEDDAVRGVQAALAMATRLRTLNVSCAIGVATGWVFCGARGSVRRRDYAMIGDVMNLAARLMQAAEELPQGQVAPIFCDAATHEAAITRLAFETLSPIAVKGKAELVPIYRPLGRERAIVRRQTALIGRGAERKRLFERLDTLRRGEHAGVVIIEGETGMGKSRLLSEVIAQAQEWGISILHGTGDAVEHASSYHAWRGIFNRIFELDTMSSEDLLARRIRVLNQLWIYPELARLSPLINAVLPLDVPENQITSQMTGQVRAENTRKLLLHVLENVAIPAPTAIILDEAHWLDSASWALVWAAAQRLRPSMLILATRPLDEPLPREYSLLREKSETLHMVLDALSAEETLQLIYQRLGVDTLPEQVAHIVLEKSEGNPFFSEELIYAMRDAGLITIENGVCQIAPDAGDLRNISFPASVQGVVVSRIDRLMPPQQLTIKVASVIGHMFALSTLNAVYPIEGDRTNLTSYLHTLERLNITSLAVPEPDLAYFFKHIIIQEVVYNLLLFSQRRELHRAVAEWYEHSYAEDLSALYPVLAHHWQKAEVHARAINYLEKAGEQALHAYANREAAGFFEELLALMPTEPAEPAALLRRARWERQLGEAYLGLGQLSESRVCLERAVALLRRPLPTSRRTFTTRTLRQVVRQTLHRLHTFHRQRSEQEQAMILETARIYELLLPIYFFANETLAATYTSLLTLNLAERAGPSVELARAYANMCIATGSLALHPLADSYARQALQTAAEVDDLATQAYARNIVGLYRVGIGKWQAARMALEEAVDICDRMGDRRNWGVNWTLLAQVAYYEGDFLRSAEMFAELYTQARSAGDVLQQAWALGGQGQSALRLGQLGQSSDFLERANRALAENAELPSQISNYGLLAMGYIRQGNLERAREAAKIAADMIERVPVPVAYYLIEGYAGFAITYLVLWEASAGQLPVQRAALAQRARQACDALAQYTRIFPIGRPRLWLCRGLAAWIEGRPDVAYRHWQRGREEAERLSMPYELGMLHYETGRHSTGPRRREHLAQAAELLARLGAAYDLSLVEKLR